MLSPTRGYWVPRRCSSLITVLVACGCSPGGCHGGADTARLDIDSGTQSGDGPKVWDDEAPTIDCVDPSTAELLGLALQDAGITYEDLGFSDEDLESIPQTTFEELNDAFLLPGYREAFYAPAELPCRGAQFASDFDFAMANPHPVASMIGEAMDLAHIARELSPIQPAEAVNQEYAELVGISGALEDALDPILLALDQATAQWTAVVAFGEVHGEHVAGDLVEGGHGVLLLGSAGDDPLRLNKQVRRESELFVTDNDGPVSLWDRARVLAYAVEDAELTRFLGLDDHVDLPFDFGRIVITGPGDGEYSDEEWQEKSVALWLDLGGDDIYRYPAGANSLGVPISVHIDLGGNDTYTYVQSDDGALIDAATSHWDLLPADEAGRYAGDVQVGDLTGDNTFVGPFSWSTQGRQGSGRFGIGLLFDLSGDDTYISPRMSQGWAHLGVGILYDQEGNDVYLAEEAAQGATANGLGLMLDVAGNDIYRSYLCSQGFNFLTGIGAAWDGDGDDVWYANPGPAEENGRVMRSTEHDPTYPFDTEGPDLNASRSQGASTGWFDRSIYEDLPLSGGLGMLRDARGDDSYTASDQAQGYGYWQSSGFLVDGDGSDTYSSLAYSQGSSVWLATGVLLDSGEGSDAFNESGESVSFLMGSSNSYGVSVLVNEAGDDSYRWPDYSAGSASCTSIGIFADNDGSDHYVAAGAGGGYAWCTEEPVDAVGLFLDSGGDSDIFGGDWDDREPGDDASFGCHTGRCVYGYSGAVDGDGESGMHATGR